MPSAQELSPCPSPFNRALARVLNDGRFTVQEVAEVAGCSDRHILNVKNGAAYLNEDKAGLVSRWLSDQGENRVAATFLSPRYAIVQREVGRADGSLDDEVVRMVHAVAEAQDRHRERDADGLERAISALRAVLADLEAERAHL